MSDWWAVSCAFGERFWVIEFETAAMMYVDVRVNWTRWREMNAKCGVEWIGCGAPVSRYLIGAM